MANTARPLAVVTGASSGIGLELARIAVGEDSMPKQQHQDRRRNNARHHNDRS